MLCLVRSLVIPLFPLLGGVSPTEEVAGRVMRSYLPWAALAALGAPSFAFIPAGLLSHSSGQQAPRRASHEHERLHTSSHRVVFVRHGQSTWNRDEKYIGWTDVPLTEEGEEEARAAGRALRKEGFEFDVVYASMLKRALKTQHLIMEELDQLWVPEVKNWRLNERQNGDLIGKTRPEAEEAFGSNKVEFWAGSYDVPAVPMSAEGQYFPKDDRRYSHLVDKNGLCAIPRTESMKDVSLRAVDYWEEEIVPAVRSGKRVLVTGHANMLKTLLQHLDGIDDDVVVGMKVPRATPMVYDLGEDMKPLRSPDPATGISADVLCVDGATESLPVATEEVNAF